LGYVRCPEAEIAEVLADDRERSTEACIDAIVGFRYAEVLPMSPLPQLLSCNRAQEL